MSLYSQYLAEKTDTHIIESDKGFATYRFTEDRAIYIIDIYVHPDYRHCGVATEMADQIADIGRKRELKKMYGSINIGTKQCTESLKVLIAYGFKLNSCTNQFLLLDKDI